VNRYTPISGVAVQIGAFRRITSAEIHRFIAAHSEAASVTSQGHG
jgi:hypothetical protein